MKKPQPKFGWHGQATTSPAPANQEPVRLFSVGDKVWIGPPTVVNRIYGEVIEFSTPPSILANMPDLVHVRVIDPGFLYPLVHPGKEDYWQEWQLELIK